ncbi:MAG: MarC family protein [Phycisphaerae bacterium]
MEGDLVTVLVDALYLLALINPISKVSVLSAFPPSDGQRELRAVTSKSSLIGAAILLAAMAFGDLLLRMVFHVQLHALQLAGGTVLFWVGFNALRKGVFFEREMQNRFEDVALVPLACPMIAGPATITACIALPAKSGFVFPALSLVIAVAINYLIMRLAGPIAAVLRRFNILGALIRITGLVVMTMGAQMALDGLAGWQSTAQA